MAFIILSPFGKKRKRPTRLSTSTGFVDQAWQELIMLRYINSPKHISSPRLIGSWIDQAHTYYSDATNSDWRSAGLLYYYSFLNLAKALLVGKRKFSYKALDTTAIHHGLSADLQDLSVLVNYQIQIYPPYFRGRKNVFSTFYEVVTGSKWPYQNVITLKLRDVLGYSDDISVESQKLFNIEKSSIRTQSMHREASNNMWFEMTIPKSQIDIARSQLAKTNLQFLDFDQLEVFDRQEWFDAFNKTNQILQYLVFVRTPSKKFDENTRQEKVQSLWKEVTQILEKYTVAPVYQDDHDPFWLFIPKLFLSGKSITWHPVLSNYLMSFALAQILRYQPQLLKLGTDNCFYAQAWCSQCARTTLGYFLMLFTDPPITLRTI